MKISVPSNMAAWNEIMKNARNNNTDMIQYSTTTECLQSSQHADNVIKCHQLISQFVIEMNLSLLRTQQTFVNLQTVVIR